jgi:hypothetical protein
MIMALNVKNKMGFIDETLQRPDNTKNPLEASQWGRCNHNVMS